MIDISPKIDAIMLLEGDKLPAQNNASETETYALVDNVPCQVIQSITDMLIKGGFIYLDLEDIKAILSDAGKVVFGVDKGKGKERIRQAANEALNSHLMPNPLKGFKRILINISTSLDGVTLGEIQRAADVVSEVAPKVNIIWGHVLDKSLGENVRVTIIAAEGR